MTITVKGDATYWKFATITNFTFFYRVNGSLWAKNIHDTHDSIDKKCYYRLTTEHWVESTQGEFRQRFIPVVEVMTDKFNELRETIDPNSVTFDIFDRAERAFFDSPSNGY